MSYRTCSRHRARQMGMRHELYWARIERGGFCDFSVILKAMYPMGGEYEKPIPGFTPNEKWEPRYIPGIIDLIYAECPFIGLLPKTELTLAELTDDLDDDLENTGSE